MTRLLPLLPLALLAACAQGGDTALTDASWVGRSEADLVSNLGVPDRVFETGGRRFLAYDPRNVAGGPYVTPSIGLGFGSFSGGWGRGSGIGLGTGLTFGGPSYSGSRGCGASYEVQDGQVIGVTRQGPGCG
jgi:hypothetical protein